MRFFSRDLVTSGLECVGVCAFAAGSFILFGVGVALLVVGVCAVAAGFLASGGGE